MLIDMKNKNSTNIKTAFILSVIAAAYSDIYGLGLITQGIIAFGSIGNFTNALIILGIVAAPIVLGIVALSLLGKEKPVTKTDRVFRILTMIFSISSIVEGCCFVFYYFVTLGFIYLID